MDKQGDDYYNAPRSSLGAGNRSSIGFFWDKAGNDTYVQQGAGLGTSHPEHRGAIRDDFNLCLGLFVDGGGDDRYLVFPTGPDGVSEGYIFAGDLDTLPAMETTGNGRNWVQAPHGRQPTSFGLGIDAADSE